MTLSVLVVDDERSVRDTLTDFLLTLSHHPRTAESAEEARQAVESELPDIVLIDLRLPDSAGLVLLKSLLAYGPQLGVVMLAGRSDVPSAILAMRSGAMDFLEKPIRLENLEASLLRTWELVCARRENAVLRTMPHQNASTDATSGPRTMADAERRAIQEALKSTGGNKLRAAKLLGIARSTLLEKLKRLNAVT